MTLLIVGLALWVLAHAFKRIAPGVRAAMGDPGKGLVAVVVVAGLVAMILGYRWAPYIHVWQPPHWMVPVNNLLMLGAVFLFGMSATTGRLRGRLRHPQLGAVAVWAVAHLLVNGDAASLILFGVLLLWALGEMALINATATWDRPEPGAARKDILLVVITLVAYAVIAGIHTALGYNPFV